MEQQQHHSTTKEVTRRRTDSPDSIGYVEVSNTDPRRPSLMPTPELRTGKVSSDTAAEEEWISDLPLAMVVTGVTLVAFPMLLDTAIVATAIPKITSQFHSLPDVGWYGSAYTLASCALQPLTGKFYTHFQSKGTFLCFLAVFELGSIICGVATSSKMLIVGRAVAGMGTSGMVNGALTIMAGAVPMHKRPVSQVGLVLGPLIGGAFTTYTTWRWCFYLNLPIGGLVALVLLFIRIPEQRQKPSALTVLPTLFKTFDIIGFMLFAPTAIMLLLALQWGGNKYPWKSVTVIGLFCGAGVTALIFLAWEYRTGKEAMIPFHLIRPRIASCSYIMVIGMFGLTIVVAYYLPIYFQAVRGHSALISGVDLLPNIICQMVMAVVSGVAVGKLGYYLPWAVFGGLLEAIGSGLLSTLGPATHAANWAAYQALVGLGRGTSTQAGMIAVQNTFSSDDVFTAMVILSFSQTFSGSVFLVAAQVVFSNGLRNLIPQYAPNIDPETVIAAGATGFRAVVPESDLPAVLVAYSKSVGRVFYLCAALSVLHFVAAWGIGWKDVSKKKEKPQDDREKGEVE